MTEFEYIKSQENGEICWATGPCCSCGQLVEDEWDPKVDKESDWWCSSCWRHEEVRRLKLQVKELDRDARHLRQELEARDAYVTELEEKNCFLIQERDDAFEARDQARAKAARAGKIISELMASS